MLAGILISLLIPLMLANKLTKLAHDRWANLLQFGDVVIDATVGNGNDTLALAKMVSATGWVHGFDLQAVALEQTRSLLSSHANVTLYHASHAEMLSHVPSQLHGRIQLIAFNLGYLPHGDHAQTTQVESTIIALQASAELLAPGGWISVLGYRGHPGGESECTAVRELFDAWNWPFEVQESGAVLRPGPAWFLVQKPAERTGFGV